MFLVSTSAYNSCAGVVLLDRQCKGTGLDRLIPSVGFGWIVPSKAHSNFIKMSYCYFQYVIELDLFYFSQICAVLCSDHITRTNLHLYKYK